jgi:two-component system, cell cycle sensor histidine kinase and response regulator CckA
MSEDGRGVFGSRLLATMKILAPDVDGDPKAHPVRHSGESAHPHLIPAYRGNETILLVDDESMLRDLLALALEQYGYNVLMAADGEDAIELADRYRAPIHLVLSDVVMPRLDGTRLCADLRRWYPGIGVLLMSGFADGELLALKLEGERTFFIRKPFSINELVAAVRAALDWRPVHRSEGE